MARKAVGLLKSEQFAEFLKKIGIDSFVIQDMNDKDHTCLFRTNLLICGQHLPAMILFDDTVYVVIQVVVAENAITDANREKACLYMNRRNESPLVKYSSDSAGHLLLTCVIPMAVGRLDSELILVLFNEVEHHLQKTYEETIRVLG